MRIGLIREEKRPFDLRVAFTPSQCVKLLNTFKDISIIVQTSAHRCFGDSEYESLGIPVKEDLSECDILLGIKEVPIYAHLPGKKYMIFSHTFKKQPYNKAMLQHFIKNNNCLIDYECLRNENGQRLIGFGRFAGIIGTHNGFVVYANRTQQFSLKRAIDCKDYEEMKSLYKNIKLPPIKIVTTGSGRVANGVLELLSFLKIKEVTKQDFLKNSYNEPVFVQLIPSDLYLHKENNNYDREDFHINPQNYKCLFEPYAEVADILINAIYWDPQSPVLFSINKMKSDTFKIKVIADISCDVNGSVPATIRTTDKEELVFGFDPALEREVKPYKENAIDIMAIHNLPTELPKDASELFGNQLINQIIPELIKKESSIIDQATICKDGHLTNYFEYLSDYVKE